jgi:hypothetical protein
LAITRRVVSEPLGQFLFEQADQAIEVLTAHLPRLLSFGPLRFRNILDEGDDF